MNAIVIDDDMSTVDVIVNTIEWKHCHIQNVYSAYNISSAKKIFQENGIDIAVCDIEMPMGSGLDLLQWARENRYETQFIFLTSHERFDFAQTAIRYNASGYVVKPFNQERLETELLIAAEKIRHEEEFREAAKYEEWFSDTIEYVEAGFWNDLLLGRIDSDLPAIREELQVRKLQIDPEELYRMIMVSSGSDDRVEEIWGEGHGGAYESAIRHLIRERMTQSGWRGNIVCYRKRNVLYAAAVLMNPEPGTVEPTADPANTSEEDIFTVWAEELQALIRKKLSVECTIYISDLYTAQELPEACSRLEMKDSNNVAAKGQVLHESEELTGSFDTDTVLPDFGRVRLLLEEKRKKELMDFLSGAIKTLTTGRKMNTDTLIRLRQDLMQTVYVYLYEKGIQAAQLFADRNAVLMEQKATESVMDMIRWQVYFIGNTIDYINEVEQSDSIIEKAKSFVREHYTEDISRVEVAESVFLTPEYMAKLFKKETGVSLKQYITDIRMQKAKQLLASPGVRVSDVAADVGFDSFSYFSTVFKKETGETPLEYKSRFS